MSTTRNTEVMADTVTTLALECAKRRKAGISEPMSFATSHRETRAQKYEENSGYLSHFKTISMISVEEIDQSNEQISKLLEKHISFYLEIIKKYIDTHQTNIQKIQVKISSLRILESLIRSLDIDRGELMRHTYNPGFDLFREYNIDLPASVGNIAKINPQVLEKYKLGMISQKLARVATPVFDSLRDRFPSFDFDFDLSRLSGMGYYDDLSFSIYGITNEGVSISLADGGFVDWIKKLIGNKKELCINSGFGTELFLSKFIN